MKVGYFCTKSYTEVGGIQRFLERINAAVRWERCFPAVIKPRPKINSPALPRGRELHGATGEQLIERMLLRLERHYQTSAHDAFLLIDDADCRFCQPPEADEIPAQLAETMAQLTEQVRAASARPEVPFFALFASPEVEAWLIADWDMSFGKAHPKLSHSLKRHLAEALAPHWDTLEGHGCPRHNGSCTKKLSEELAAVLSAPEVYEFAGLDPAEHAATYSKKTDGVFMLQQIRPEQVARRCSVIFAPTFRQLQAL